MRSASMVAGRVRQEFQAGKPVFSPGTRRSAEDAAAEIGRLVVEPRDAREPLTSGGQCCAAPPVRETEREAGGGRQLDLNVISKSLGTLL